MPLPQEASGADLGTGAGARSVGTGRRLLG